MAIPLSIGIYVPAPRELTETLQTFRSAYVPYTVSNLENPVWEKDITIFFGRRSFLTIFKEDLRMLEGLLVPNGTFGGILSGRGKIGILVD